MIRWAFLVSAAACLFVSKVQAAPTCDANSPQTCCDWWQADVSQHGQAWGHLSKESYAEIVRALRVSQDIDAEQCRFWGDPNNSSCHTGYGAPYCASVERGVLAGILEHAKQLTLPAKKAYLWEMARKVLDFARDQQTRLGRLQGLLGKRGRAPKLGDSLRDYAIQLNNGISRVSDLERMLALQWEGAGYGYAGGEFDIPGMLLALDALNTTVDAARQIRDFEVTPPPAPAAPLAGSWGFDETQQRTQPMKFEFTITGDRIVSMGGAMQGTVADDGRSARLLFEAKDKQSVVRSTVLLQLASDGKSATATWYDDQGRVVWTHRMTPLP